MTGYGVINYIYDAIYPKALDPVIYHRDHFVIAQPMRDDVTL